MDQDQRMVSSVATLQGKVGIGMEEKSACPVGDAGHQDEIHHIDGDAETDAKSTSQRDTELPPANIHANPFASLPRLRKNLLFAIIATALAIDVLGTWGGLFVAIDAIAEDIGLAQGGKAIWIVSAYAVAFAACIPLGGRLCDIYPAQWWFTGAFLVMACLNLGNSFVHEPRAFLALRALQGICGALTQPSGFSMIVRLFPDKREQQKRLIGVAMIFVLGSVGGFLMLHNLSGALLSLAHWRWIFRFIAITSFSGASIGWLLMPRSLHPKRAPSTSRLASCVQLIRRLDLVGVILVMGALLLFNLALINATVDGYQNARFIVPFVLGLVLFPSFCWWEANQEERYAMLPVAIMKEPKFLVVCYTGVCAEMWFVTTELGPSRFFQEALHDSGIQVAGKLSIMCAGCVMGGLVHAFYLSKKVPAKYRLLAGMTCGIVPSLTLLVLSGGGAGDDFWRYIFPAYFVGGFAMSIVFQVCNVLIIQSVPAEYSGIGSSVFQMCAQTGVVIGSSVQAVLYTAVDNNLADWRGHQYGFYFVIGCLTIATVIVGMILPVGDREELEEADAKSTEMG